MDSMKQDNKSVAEEIEEEVTKELIQFNRKP
jgi:hypothetical protein